MPGKTLIDTSIWIDFFNNKKSPHKNFISVCLSEDMAFSCSVIITELITGAKSDKEINIIKSIITGTKVVTLTDDDYLEAGMLGNHLRSKGVSIPLPDLIIASACVNYKLSLLTLDKHFTQIKKYIDISIL